MIGLFPGKYIHIGGDEVDKANWKKCPKCQARIKQEGLKNEHELQSYFVQRIERFINAQGRTLIGWDEILEGGLAPNATVMSWRNVESGVVAASAGHDVVMTPTSHCYLDYYQAKTGEPRGIGGFLPLAKVYGFEPLPPDVPADKAKHILGAGGNLWSEFFPNYAHVQYMAYPRACADGRGDVDRPEAQELGRLQAASGDAARAAEGARGELPRPRGRAIRDTEDRAANNLPLPGQFPEEERGLARPTVGWVERSEPHHESSRWGSLRSTHPTAARLPSDSVRAGLASVRRSQGPRRPPRDAARSSGAPRASASR